MFKIGDKVHFKYSSSGSVWLGTIVSKKEEFFIVTWDSVDEILINGLSASYHENELTLAYRPDKKTGFSNFIRSLETT